MSFFYHLLESTFLFWFENKGAKLFLIWVISWISIWKLSWVFRGKIDVILENDFWLPKPARSAQTVENHIAFSMFPILDTNLWSALKKPPWKFNFFHILGSPYQVEILRTLFCVLQYSRNSQWNENLTIGSNILWW